METAHWQPIAAEQLRIGHFVRIGDRWFDHPFLKSQFRVATEAELAAIRDAGLARIYFDPARSVPEPEPATHAAPSSGDEPDVRSSKATSAPGLPAGPERAPPATPADEPQIPVLRPAAGAELAAARTPSRPIALPRPDPRALRENLQQSRDDYRAAVDGATAALGMLDAGDPLGAEATRAAVRQVLALAAGRDRPLTSAPVGTTLGGSRRQASLAMDAAALAAAVGRRLKLPAADLQALTTAALVHAIGKSRLPPQLHDEARATSREARAELQRYPRLGAAMLREYPEFAPEVIQIVEQHRERLDGSGFPARARGAEIHPLAPVVGAIHEFQVLAARDGTQLPAAALAQLYLHLRGAYGASTVEHVIAALTVYPPGAFVELADGRIARVARVSERERMTPLVWIFDENLSPTQAPVVDLSEAGHPAIARVLDPRTLAADLRAWFGGDWAGLTFPAPVAPPMGARPPGLLAG